MSTSTGLRTPRRQADAAVLSEYLDKTVARGAHVNVKQAADSLGIDRMRVARAIVFLQSVSQWYWSKTGQGRRPDNADSSMSPREHRLAVRRARSLAKVRPCDACGNSGSSIHQGGAPDRYDGQRVGLQGKICRECWFDQIDANIAAEHEPVDRRRVFAALTSRLASVDGLSYRQARPLAIARYGHPRA